MGLSYKRGYLFHGPPGSGKTSMVLAMSNESKRPIYRLVLSKMDSDDALDTVFSTMPGNCVVVLEDVDCASTVTHARLLRDNPEEKVKVTHFEGGENALMFAVRERHVQCVELLLRHCPEEQVRATNDDGKTALMFASDARCMELLLQYCPEEQAMSADSTNQCTTPLMTAAGMGYTSIVQLLLQYSIESQIKAVNRDGANALMYAANDGHAHCLELLLQHYPEEQVKATTHRGDMTALMIAADGGHTSCIELLLRHFPEHQVASKNKDGYSAVAIAAEEGYLDIVKLLLAHNPSERLLSEAIRILEDEGHENGPMSENQRDCLVHIIAARELQRSRIRRGPKANKPCRALLASFLASLFV